MMEHATASTARREREDWAGTDKPPVGRQRLDEAVMY